MEGEAAEFDGLFDEQLTGILTEHAEAESVQAQKNECRQRVLDVALADGLLPSWTTLDHFYKPKPIMLSLEDNYKLYCGHMVVGTIGYFLYVKEHPEAAREFVYESDDPNEQAVERLVYTFWHVRRKTFLPGWIAVYEKMMGSVPLPGDVHSKADFVYEKNRESDAYFIGSDEEDILVEKQIETLGLLRKLVDPVIVSLIGDHDDSDALQKDITLLINNIGRGGRSLEDIEERRRNVFAKVARCGIANEVVQSLIDQGTEIVFLEQFRD